MSTYGIAGSGGPLADLSDDPEVLFTEFLRTNWSDIVSGVPLAEIDLGYEPDGEGQTKRYIIKVEEAFTKMSGMDFPDKYTQYDIFMDAHIWERDVLRYKNTIPNSARYKIRRYIERFIKQNINGMYSLGIKHLYLVDAKNIPEPEREDWHHAVVTFRMLTFKVSTI